MSLVFIIDGYNIINHPVFFNKKKKTIKDTRAILLEFIQENKLCGSHRNRAIIVFDGYPNIQERITANGNIRVVFSGNDSADKRIKAILENNCEPKNTVVVSDDKEIRFFAQACGAKVKTVEEFINPKLLTEKKINYKKIKEGYLDYELGFTEIRKINEELKKIWLR
ncbi:MAG: NYN domain-containing protein [Candidatus Omnitrophica bacterium]|nr:NYN domain-containing protein [Candidatus Omnitrophota bacterium]